MVETSVGLIRGDIKNLTEKSHPLDIRGDREIQVRPRAHLARVILRVVTTQAVVLVAVVLMGHSVILVRIPPMEEGGKRKRVIGDTHQDTVEQSLVS